MTHRQKSTREYDDAHDSMALRTRAKRKEAVQNSPPHTHTASSCLLASPGVHAHAFQIPVSAVPAANAERLVSFLTQSTRSVADQQQTESLLLAPRSA